jgi:hypothetical protein
MSWPTATTTDPSLASTTTIATLPALTTPWEPPWQCSTETVTLKGGECTYDGLGSYCSTYQFMDAAPYAWANWPYQPFPGTWTSTECFPTGFSYFQHSYDYLDFFYTPATACPSAWMSASEISASRYSQSVTLCCPS